MKEHPSASLAFPHVGWQGTVEQPTHTTAVCAWLKTVVGYSILGTSHPWSRNRGSAPGAASCVSSSLLGRDGGDPLWEACLRGQVVTAGKAAVSVHRSKWYVTVYLCTPVQACSSVTTFTLCTLSSFFILRTGTLCSLNSCSWLILPSSHNSAFCLWICLF